MFHHILVALDDSDFSEQVFHNALDLAKAMRSRLLLLHVLNPVDRDYPHAPIYPAVEAYYSALYNEALQRWQEELADYEKRRLAILRSLTSEAEAVGVATEFTQNIGEPGRIICAIARTWGADLIILGRRGRSGVSELVLGSVSNYVMHHAPCSVLIAQHPATATANALQNREMATTES
ncbi:universal stress protein [Oculatella sp. LEGE 06141]|uniref:universal stress protein n=1 Tax=Oculatella sp. LEGE 06141 TaxID=1828648 RepID=UPI0018824DD5|nr:universal stress protein [Oculatella sp. LEGE 06141]MBE9181696.1 universal stress protein [Oculatella sp. LEGE 06141]